MAYKSYKPPCENAMNRNLFAERVVNVRNSLPYNVDFSFLSEFKKSFYCNFIIFF